MKTGKQIWCFLLALALILGLFPTAAQPVQATEAVEIAEPTANPVVRFHFNIAGAGTIVVNGEDVGTSVEVESGSDLTFSVEAPGYQVNVVLRGGNRPMTPNSDGTYTINSVNADMSITIMVTQKDNQSLSFAVTGAIVTVDGEDYTNAAYSARYNEKITFSVVPEIAGSEVTVTADNCTVIDHGDGTYTTSGIIADTRITVTADGEETKIFRKLTFSFNIPGVGSIFVDDVDMGTSFEVEQGTDVTFRIVAPGYKVGVLLRGGRPVTPNGDGSYTISNILNDQSLTVMLTEVVEGKAEVTFRCTNAKVMVGDEDCTNGTYSHPGGSFRFEVEVPEGYYVRSITATPNQEIYCGSEIKDQKIWYSITSIEADNKGNITIDIVAEKGEEDTWPLEYEYSMNGPAMTYARVKACAPTYEGTLDIPETVIHNGVPFTVQQIKDYAFMECYTLTELSMPDTVRTIGIDAFAYTGLRHIRLSENLESMETECFFKCIYLEEIVLPESLKKIPNNAFDSCYSLQTIELPDSLQAIGKYAFTDCRSLTEISIPVGITEIEKSTFSSCKSLEKVIFGGRVTSIGDKAFYNTMSLKRINLPECLTSLGEGAFQIWYADSEVDRNGGLEEIVLPAGITEIGDETFKNCYDLRKVTFLGNVTTIGKDAFRDTKSLRGIDLPTTLVSIGNYAFYGSGLQKILLPKDCVEIGTWAFAMTLLEAFEVEPENLAFQAGSDGVLYSRDGKRLVIYPCGKADTTYAVQAGTECIEMYAFYCAPYLERITFPGSLREIGNAAFNDLPKLKTVILPEGLEDISSGHTFSDCPALTELALPSTLRDISGTAVFGGIGITELILPSGLQDISGEGVFALCENLKRVVFPSDMKEISGSRIFTDCNALSELELPENLEKISGSFNFVDIAIEKLILPEMLQELGRGSFSTCKKLSEVVLPDGLQVLGVASFESCISLTGIELPENLTELRSNTFSGCRTLESIQIPKNVTSIGSRCFFDCKMLEPVELPAGVKNIGDSCFDGCEKLESIELPFGLQTIGKYAFACTNIRKLSIPATVTSLGDCPIGVIERDGAYALDTEHTYVLYFAGNQPEWGEIDPLPNVTNMYCYFPSDNNTWTESLRYLIDGPRFYRVHWLAADIALPESKELMTNHQLQLTAAVRPTDDPNLPLTWTSSDETVVQVDETGMCTGIAPGTAVITASAGGGAYSAQCQVTVLENSAPHYEDVPESAWYYEAVQYTSAHGLFQGMTETKFGPNVTMTRGMLVTVLYRMEGEPTVEGQTHPFTDVDASRYYGDAITWAANSGVVNGMSDTRFAPEAAVTREQMVTILYRYAKLKDADVTAKGDLESFPDHDQVKPYARDAFSWAVGAGIIQGDSNGSVATLSPRDSATRAQVAAVLMRYLEQLG